MEKRVLPTKHGRISRNLRRSAASQFFRAKTEENEGEKAGGAIWEVGGVFREIFTFDVWSYVALCCSGKRPEPLFGQSNRAPQHNT